MTTPQYTPLALAPAPVAAGAVVPSGIAIAKLAAALSGRRRSSIVTLNGDSAAGYGAWKLAVVVEPTSDLKTTDRDTPRT